MENDAVLELSDLSCGYHGRALLTDLDFLAAKGQIISIIGPNGAGKSTLLKTIIGQLKKISGRISFVGHDADRYAPEEMARLRSCLLTESVRGGHMTAFDLVAAGRYPHTGRMGHLTDRDRSMIDRSLAYVDAEGLRDRPFAELSDGQKQRILLARALCQEPRLLILDEPTAFLDIRFQLNLMMLVRKLARTEGMTVVMSLHEIDLAMKISDRILLIGKNHKVTIGTPEDFLLVPSCPAIGSLFGINRGSYDPLTGSAELEPPYGEPQVFVLSSGGTGIPMFRKLVREGVPFAAGILYENDVDYPLARNLASRVVSLPAFSEITDEAIAEALALINSCQSAVNAGIVIGPLNAKMQVLVDAVKARTSS